MASDIDLSTATEGVEWSEIEGVLAEIAVLAKADIDFDHLARELLDRTLQMLAARGGSIRISDGRGPLRVVSQIGREVIGDNYDVVSRRTCEQVLSSGETQVVVSNSNQSGSSTACDSTGVMLLVSPLKVDRVVVGLIEIIQRPTTDPDVVRGNRRFVALVGELASDYLNRHELRELRQSEIHSSRMESFVRRVHATLDFPAVAYELVNDGRQLIGCDRVSLATKHGSAYRLVAVSGIDTIDRRSNAVRRLENLASAIGRTGLSFWYGDDDRALPTQILGPLNSYLDQAHIRMMGVIPLAPSNDEVAAGQAPILAVLIVEQFSADFDVAMRDRTRAAAEHGKLAVLNALRYQSLPTLPFARRRNLALGRRSIGWHRALAVAAAACVLGLLLMVPADFCVHAEGKLQPAHRQEVFAPRDGQVIKLAVEHGQHVKAGSVLAEMASPELELDIQRVQGEYEMARKKLAEVESTILQSGTSKERSSSRAGQLAAEQEELIKQLDSQRKQLNLLHQEHQKLVVRSPVDGQVLTWDLDHLLQARPVERGQALMSIAEVDGRWTAEIDVPDNRVGYLKSRQAERKPLIASFRLSTGSRGVYHGTVRNLAARTELNEENRPVVKLTMDFDQRSVPELRPGATVFARIGCGRKPLGYVWLHDLIEAFRGWLFF
jgi:multidrug efflux pump subunit AcrA (membrane-fusion protein)